MYLLTPFIAFLVAFSLFTEVRTQDLHRRIIRAAESTLVSRYPQADNSLEVRVVRTGGVIKNSDQLELIWPQTPEIPRALLRVDIQSNDTEANNYSGWALLYVAHFDSGQ